ncbi:MAG TPA: hypothetical protein VE988_18590, partial [Gemmataceae bacterium]|nr:hypothetical protein [Gemmataceae bacterium]
MNFFGWKRQSRKWLTVAVTAVMTLTMLPAQGRSETFWQYVVGLAKPQKSQCQCCPNAACCPEGQCCIKPECCPQGVCTGACTMPCCPVECANCEAHVQKLYRVAAICSMLGHHEAAQYFYYVAKKVSAKAKADCDGYRPCPVNKPHRGCEGCCEECCVTAEQQAEKLRRLCAVQARTIEEIHVMLTDLTREVSALREEVQAIHHGQATHFTAPCNIQPTHWIVPPVPTNLPTHTLTPHI